MIRLLQVIFVGLLLTLAATLCGCASRETLPQIYSSTTTIARGSVQPETIGAVSESLRARGFRVIPSIKINEGIRAERSSDDGHAIQTGFEEKWTQVIKIQGLDSSSGDILVLAWCHYRPQGLVKHSKPNDAQMIKEVEDARQGVIDTLTKRPWSSSPLSQLHLNTLPLPALTEHSTWLAQHK